MSKYFCTAEHPAPPGTRKYVGGVWQWNTYWQHPDAKGTCINDDHDDWRYECPHCGNIMIYEGPDA